MLYIVCLAPYLLYIREIITASVAKTQFFSTIGGEKHAAKFLSVESMTRISSLISFGVTLSTVFVLIIRGRCSDCRDAIIAMKCFSADNHAVLEAHGEVPHSELHKASQCKITDQTKHDSHECLGCCDVFLALSFLGGVWLGVTDEA